MDETETKQARGGNFHLSKWFLDYISESGEAMVFYSAKLTWHGWSASYTSWLHFNASSGVRLKSRFRNVQIPQVKDIRITWNDTLFGVSGEWEPLAEPIQARLVDSEEGFLDWKCFQPASKVHLRINNESLEGRGYAEQLILTIPPWRIPMDELRWGRFGSEENCLVWIELREKEIRQWLWFNGERIQNCIIEDDHIALPERDLILNLDRGVSLEAEKKISIVVDKLVRYIPGFKKVIPLTFLMADEYKWLSKGQLQKYDKTISNGQAIHELVNFKASNPCFKH